jgi:hypothetical protein
LINPPDPQLESINGDTYIVAVDFPVKFGFWLRELQFTIPAGTRTDIASIPRLFRSINDRASLGILAPVIHDFLCDQRGRVENIQGEIIQVHWFDANLLFLMLLRLDGISWHRALIAFIGVTIGSPRW